jgi:hypothetical protein
VIEQEKKLGADKNAIVATMRDCVNAISKWTQSYRAVGSDAQAQSAPQPGGVWTSFQGSSQVVVLSPSMYTTERSFGSSIQQLSSDAFVADPKSVSGKQSADASKVQVNATHCWVGPEQVQNSNSHGGKHGQPEQYIELAFMQSQNVVSVLLQGGCVHTSVLEESPATTMDSNAGVPASQSAPQSLASAVPLSRFALPSSGLTLSTITGDPQQTIDGMGELIDWSVMLKKNAPEKFLKRPPVRFIFDLVKFVGESVGAEFMPESVAGADWESVQASKQSKSDYMDSVSRLLCSLVLVMGWWCVVVLGD